MGHSKKELYFVILPILVLVLGLFCGVMSSCEDSDNGIHHDIVLYLPTGEKRIWEDVKIHHTQGACIWFYLPNTSERVFVNLARASGTWVAVPRKE